MKHEGRGLGKGPWTTAANREWGTRAIFPDGRWLTVWHGDEPAFVSAVLSSISMAVDGKGADFRSFKTIEPGAAWGFVVKDGQTLPEIVAYWKGRGDVINGRE